MYDPKEYGLKEVWHKQNKSEIMYSDGISSGIKVNLINLECLFYYI